MNAQRKRIRTLARRKAADAIEGAISHGDGWTFKGANGEALSPEEERLLVDELRRVIIGLRNLKQPPRSTLL